MKKLLLATVCVIVLAGGAPAKPVQLGLIDDPPNKWAIEYDSELIAGACIATTNYNLFKLRVCPKTLGGITEFSEHEAD
jgi:hypothetical protein